jgi:hypothetical protein
VERHLIANQRLSYGYTGSIPVHGVVSSDDTIQINVSG